MAATQATVLPKSPMGEALSYTLKLETALRRGLDSGRQSIDNDTAKRALRAVAVARRHWLCFQTEGVGETAVVLLSLVVTAKVIGVDPRVHELTPHRWPSIVRARSASLRLKWTGKTRPT